jgi:predicted ester cyclase
MGVVRVYRMRRLDHEQAHPREDSTMSTADNKDVVGRWFTEFWGPEFNPAVIHELAAPEIRFEYSLHAPCFEYSLHAPCRGREEVRAFATTFRAAFPDLSFGGTADLIGEGDYVVDQWEGGGTQTGDAFDDMPIGSLPAGTGKATHFTGITVLKVQDGLITEEIGLDDGVSVLQQLGLITSA